MTRDNVANGSDSLHIISRQMSNMPRCSGIVSLPPPPFPFRWHHCTSAVGNRTLCDKHSPYRKHGSCCVSHTGPQCHRTSYMARHVRVDGLTSAALAAHRLASHRIRIRIEIEKSQITITNLNFHFRSCTSVSVVNGVKVKNRCIELT